MEPMPPSKMYIPLPLLPYTLLFTIVGLAPVFRMIPSITFPDTSLESSKPLPPSDMSTPLPSPSRILFPRRIGTARSCTTTPEMALREISLSSSVPRPPAFTSTPVVLQSKMRLLVTEGSPPSEITIPSRWCPQMSLLVITGLAFCVTMIPAPVLSWMRLPVMLGRVFCPRTRMTASEWEERSQSSRLMAPADTSTPHSHPPPHCRSVRLRTVPFIARKLSTGLLVDSMIVSARLPTPMMSTSTAAMEMLS
mmetsp:Transcript_63160/g.131347  ORF Transcript_63160/g.131347 Transcript_63160/m.131347 type:complete len:251 (+) Transcript_63160:712-1464(+)